MEMSNSPLAAPNRSVIFVLPTKNEEKTILSVIESLRAEAMKLPRCVLARIIVVDDSTDSTSELLKGLKDVEVLPGGGKGLGRAMDKALKHALIYRPDYVVSMDADGQAVVGELPLFMRPILEDRADLVLGSRFLVSGLVHYQYPRFNRFGIRLLVAYLRMMTGLPITDSHGGLRAMRAAVLERLKILGTHTYVQESILSAHEAGFRIMEVPSVWAKREYGQSRVLRSIPKYIVSTLPILLLRIGRRLFLPATPVGRPATQVGRPNGGL